MRQLQEYEDNSREIDANVEDSEQSMNSSVSGGSSPEFEQIIRRKSSLTVAWDEKVLWPGILSLY